MLAVLAGTVVGLARDWGEPPKLLLLALGGLTVTGLVSPERAFAGFSSPAVVVVGAFMAIAMAFERSPALRWLGARASAAGLAPVAAVSALVPNTPLVAVLIPAVRRHARERSKTPAALLMPLSFAGILGGACTLVGTSSNLVVHGLLLDAGDPGLGVFELAWVGVPVALVGLAYLTWVAPRLLPDRPDPLASLDHNPREYVARLSVTPSRRYDGAVVGDLRHLEGLFVVGVEREGVVTSPVSPRFTLQAADVLVFAGQLEAIAGLAAEGSLAPPEHDGGEPLAGAHLFEAVVSPTSPLIGRNVREAGFRARYDAAVLAVHRHGERLGGRIGDIVVRTGDTLLLAAGDEFLARWGQSRDFYLASAAGRVTPSPTGRDWIPAGVLLAVVGCAMSGALPLLRAAVAGVLALIVSGHLRGPVLWRGLRLQTLVLIAASIGLGNAFLDAGAGELLAAALARGTGGLGPQGVIAALLVVSGVLTELIHKSAVAALMFPIAAGLAAASGAPLHAAGYAVALGCAWSFVTPSGYQTNAMVASAAGYRGSDFLRVGLPLKVLALGLGAALLPWALSG